jgi:hypothetical protein
MITGYKPNLTTPRILAHSSPLLFGAHQWSPKRLITTVRDMGYEALPHATKTKKAVIFDPKNPKRTVEIPIQLIKGKKTSGGKDAVGDNILKQIFAFVGKNLNTGKDVPFNPPLPPPTDGLPPRR